MPAVQAVAEARALRELGVPIAALELLERATKDALVSWDEETLRAVAAEAAAAAEAFPEHADRAFTIAERAAAAVGIPVLLEPPRAPDEPASLAVPLAPPPRRASDEPASLAVPRAPPPPPARPRLALDSTPLGYAGPYKRLWPLARAAQAPLVALAALQLACVVLVSRELESVAAARGGLYRLQPAAARGETLGLVAETSIALTLVAVALFVVWLRRAVANLAPLGARQLPYGTWWAVFSWLVPVLNLWRPKAVVDEVWRASDPHLPRDEGMTWTRLRAPVLVTAWWLLFVVSSIAQLVAVLLRSRADTLADLALADNLLLASACMSLFALPLAFAVVEEITRRQQARASVVL